MNARELLGAVIRGYGLFLVVVAVLGAINVATEFVFGDARFGGAFRLVLSTGGELVVGLILMKKADGIMKFMGWPPPASPA